MILIADSGSTKTDWVGLDNQGNRVFKTTTAGLNPDVFSEQFIKECLTSNDELKEHRNTISQVFFYGAGTGTSKPKQLLHYIFTDFFKNANQISIKEDMYASVYATTKPNEQAMVCILGTGSNCCYYDGKNIHQKIKALGYLIMDEASGNYFGKELIRDYYYSKIPKKLAVKFAEKYNLDADVLKTNFYKNPNPNTYLASFAKFLIENKHEIYCKQFIKKGLQLFINNHILQYDEATYVPIHFIGSIAYYLQDELEVILKENDLTLGNVIQKPIDGLVSYHKHNLMK